MMRFKKRSYTFRGMIHDIARVARSIPDIIKHQKEGTISRKFTERLMLAVTAVNGCRYCSFVHTKMALESGCTDEEIKDIMQLQFDSFEDEEIIGLTFAQHYAETNRNPSKKAVRRLVAFYGEERSRAIIQTLDGIWIGNLAGNTLDAFQSRLKGIPPENGSFLLELIVFVIGSIAVRLLFKMDSD